MGCFGSCSRSSSSSIVIPHASENSIALGRSVTGRSHVLFSRSQRACGKLCLRASTSSLSYGVFRASLFPCSFSVLIVLCVFY